MKTQNWRVRVVFWQFWCDETADNAYGVVGVVSLIKTNVSVYHTLKNTTRVKSYEGLKINLLIYSFRNMLIVRLDETDISVY